MERTANINTNGWFWKAPDYFSKWRVFPRLFISVYIWIVYTTAEWFMALQDPSAAQAGFVSVIVGVGAAWFGLYVNSGYNPPSKIVITSASGDTSGEVSVQQEAKG